MHFPPPRQHFCHLTDKNNCCKKANQICSRHFRKFSNSRCYFPSSKLPCYHCLIQQAEQELIQSFQGYSLIRVIQANLAQNTLASFFTKGFLSQNETHPSSPSTSKFRDKHFLFSAHENIRKLSFAISTQVLRQPWKTPRGKTDHPHVKVLHKLSLADVQSFSITYQISWVL